MYLYAYLRSKIKLDRDVKTRKKHTQNCGLVSLGQNQHFVFIFACLFAIVDKRN